MTTATLDFTDGIQVETTPGTTKRGMTIVQSGPNSEPVVGPVYYNQTIINNDVTPTGDDRSIGHYTEINSGGPNERGHVFGHFVLMNHNVASDADGDHVAIQTITVSNVPDTGAGELYGMATGCHALAGAVTPGVSGISLDVSVEQGATAQYRTPARLAAHRNSRAVTVNDAAALVLNNGTIDAAFKNGMLFSRMYGEATIQPDGNVIAFEGAHTVKDVLNLTNLTVTGKILRALGISISGEGEIVTNKPITVSSIAPEIVLHEQDGPADCKYWSMNANGGVLKLDYLNSTFDARTNRLTIAKTKPIVTGSRSDGTALASLLTAFAAMNLITNSTTA